ncbi:MAG TPA: hypothetical protein IAB70_02190 [Candidatus Merdicola faecigallinarum]|uniref:Uncharacterized protein n=1 Tax=Candidatus Merdicola faecigallinarum TaxID=2840862 RepID=A0A9D1S939_9FIRM|nr:hypothetical protein [Candidatus Merdicola faecigallinarum]
MDYMNEEEKKAIEIVKKIKNIKFNVTSSFYSSGTISLSIEEKEAIETALNLITKLQKENEDIKSRKEYQKIRFKRYKENIDKQHEEIYENLVFENEKYKYLYQKALDNTVKADKENMQLKKQIDLMAEQLKIPEPTMKIESFDIKPKTKFGMRYLNKEEVKQYFEKKVEAEGE